MEREAEVRTFLALVDPGGRHRLYRIRPRWLRLVDNGRGLGEKRELTVEGDHDGRH